MSRDKSEWHTRGYQKLAGLMSRKPRASILRRFGALDMLRLFRMQAELIDLETQYIELCKEDDQSSDSDRNMLSADFWLLEHNNSAAFPRRDLLDRIGEKMQKYGKLC